MRRYLHANDNTKKGDNSTKLFKVEPVVNAVRSNCLKIEQECHQSIEEKMITLKTKRSGIRQYMPKKIHKWGFKNVVRAGKSGMIYDFFIYAGPKSAGREKCGAGDTVLRLVEELPKNRNFQIFIDIWFSTLSLFSELRSMGILVTGTFRSNRLAGSSMVEKDLKKQGRGSFDYRTGSKFWNNSGVECTDTVERYNQTEKRKCESTVPIR